MTDKCGITEYCEMRTGDICTLGSPCPHQKPLTNEEWFCQLSTEEKALFLARLYGHSRKINLPELLFRNVGTREVTDVAEYIGKWLKEKRHE